jgi:hypothetical protein
VPNNTSKRAPEQPSPILRAALAYARLGWPVFPLHPDDPPGTPKNDRKSKRPIHGYKFQRRGTRWAASSDPAFVEWMFGELHPDALVGVIGGLDARDPRADWMKGPVRGSQIFFVDIDVAKPGEHDHDGAPKLAALVARHGPLPDTLTSVGLDGGKHYVFRCPPGRKVVSRVLIDEFGFKMRGVDIKAEGGYVAAPPSRGRRWIDWHTPVADATDWLLDLACETPEINVAAKHRSPATRPLFTAVRWAWEPPDPQSQSAASAPDAMLAMMREDSALGLSLDPRDYDLDQFDRVSRIRYALAVIPNVGFDYDEWVKMGASIYNYVGDAGFEPFDDWSMKSPAYDMGFTSFKWFQDNGISGFPRLEPGSKVFFHANEHDPNWQLRWLVEQERELHRGMGL